VCDPFVIRLQYLVYVDSEDRLHHIVHHSDSPSRVKNAETVSFESISGGFYGRHPAVLLLLDLCFEVVKGLHKNCVDDSHAEADQQQLPKGKHVRGRKILSFPELAFDELIS
jgi:hypothetical protein